jgi:hypothetical protein
MVQKVSTQVADCYERAGESRARATCAASEIEKTEYLNIERRWIMLARSYEWSERITGFNEEVRRRLRVLIPPAPPHPALPRLICTACGGRMRLTQIEPVPRQGHFSNTSTFACKCGFTCLQAGDGQS